MSRPGNPYDNATCESFFKTLKREEICTDDFYDLEHLLESVGTFIERYYNRCRLHSELGYRSPDEFEKESGSGDAVQGFTAPVLHLLNSRGPTKGRGGSRTG
jgi:transposase InsO family protein